MKEIMRKVTLDAEKSRSLFLERPKLYKIRECYANIYRAITENFAKASAGAWKVAYGYYTIGEMPNLLARHCFILDEDNHVIDPTIFTHENINLTHQYYVMYIFPSLSDYLQTLESEDFRPSLNKYLRRYEQEANCWANTHNFFLCG